MDRVHGTSHDWIPIHGPCVARVVRATQIALSLAWEGARHRRRWPQAVPAGLRSETRCATRWERWVDASPTKKCKPRATNWQTTVLSRDLVAYQQGVYDQPQGVDRQISITPLWRNVHVNEGLSGGKASCRIPMKPKSANRFQRFRVLCALGEVCCRGTGKNSEKGVGLIRSAIQIPR